MLRLVSIMFTTPFSLVVFFLINYVNLENASSGENHEKNILDDYDWDLWCKLQPNGHDCTEDGEMLPKFYYDVKMGDCKSFSYGACPLTKNVFERLHDCHENCKEAGFMTLRVNLTNKANIYCRFQPDFGWCNNYFPMWYYDVTLQMCKGFSYSGCGGNLNRFANAQLCAAVCAVS